MPLAQHVHLHLGGPARRMAVARNAREVRRLLRWARARSMPVLPLGGGSNVVPADAGWPGLVLKLGNRDLSFRPAGKEGPGSRRVILEAAAGVRWDRLAAESVRRGLAGVERLSGIPGTAGAAPVQNIGAYGQELADTLCSVYVLDRKTLEERILPARACGFGYRRSRFNREDRGRFVILRIRLVLRPVRPDPAEASAEMAAVRGRVLATRRRKGMLPDQRPASAGSFFRNPVLDEEAFREVKDRWRISGGKGAVPFYRTDDDGAKIPAAWLVEQTGFPRGTRRGPVGVSPRHALALVHYGGGTAQALWCLADEIREAVRRRFGVRLEVEPEAIDPSRNRNDEAGPRP